jgi:hypothetical protein
MIKQEYIFEEFFFIKTAAITSNIRGIHVHQFETLLSKLKHVTIFALLPNSADASLDKQKDIMLALNNYSNFSTS